MRFLVILIVVAIASQTTVLPETMPYVGHAQSPSQTIRTDFGATVLRANVASPYAIVSARGRGQAIIRGRGLWQKIEADAAQLRALRDEIDAVSTMINATVHDFLDANVTTLGADTEAVYNSIQHGALIPVNVSLKFVVVGSGRFSRRRDGS